MMVIRPVRLEDLNGVERCALTASAGLTHLPRHRDALMKLLEHSIDSFSREVVDPQNELYLFVLENIENGEVCGTSAIISRTGVPIPFYVYRIETLRAGSTRLPVPREPRLLRLYPYINGPTEIGALYLFPEYRKGGLGKLLSFSRFLFIASHQNRCTRNIIANMRGVIDNDFSPFWNGIGRHFLNVDLPEVLLMRQNNEHLISEIFPPYPVYVTLLPSDVQKVLGNVHVNTVAALKMLEDEGFHFKNEIDPVDGGPIITAEVHHLRTLQHSQLAEVKEITHEGIEGEQHLIANTRLDFRACLGALHSSERHVTISAKIAEALEVKQGDLIRFIPCPHTKHA